NLQRRDVAANNLNHGRSDRSNVENANDPNGPNDSNEPNDSWPKERTCDWKTGPGNRDDDDDQRDAEEDHRRAVLAPDLRRLPNPDAPDVNQGDGDQHAGRVFDGEEPRRRNLHRRGEVAHAQPRDRAEEDVEDEADEELQVGAD